MTARTSLSIWRTPEACQEISRGLSERQRAQPPVIRSKKRPHPSGVRGVLAPLQGAIVVGFVGPVVRAKKRARTTGEFPCTPSAWRKIDKLEAHICRQWRQFREHSGHPRYPRNPRLKIWSKKQEVIH